MRENDAIQSNVMKIDITEISSDPMQVPAEIGHTIYH